jgi:hypothetical protein
MKEYKEMYLHLFNEVTTAIEILKEAQKKCEEMFINAEEDEKTDAFVSYPSSTVSDGPPSPEGEGI